MPFGSAPTGLPGPAAVSSASSSQPGWSPWAAAVPHANRASEPLQRFHRRAEADDVVTVGFRRLRAHNTMLTRRDAKPGRLDASAPRPHGFVISGIAFGLAPGS